MKKDFWKVEVLHFLGTKDLELVTDIRVPKKIWTKEKIIKNFIPKKIWLSIHPRNFSNHVTVRPSVRFTGKPNVKCQTFQLLWETVTCVQLDNRLPYYCQLTAFKTEYPLTTFTWPYGGAQVPTHRGHVPFWSFPLSSS